MVNILEIDSVFLEFKSRVILNNIYLKSITNEVTGLLGRNGSGKSSLLKIIYGEIAIAQKSVRINKRPIGTNFRSPKDMMYLPQNNFIPNELTLKRVFQDYKLNFLDFLFYFPTFEKLYNLKIKKISGGEKRVIETYLILVSNSKFCFLDEPFTMVMPCYIEILKKIINKEKKYKGIIITDHLYEHIMEISDTLYIISNRKSYLINNNKDLEKHGYIRGLEKPL